MTVHYIDESRRGATDDTERTAPHNLGAERSILGSLIRTGDTTHLLEIAATGLEAEHFYRPAHGDIYTAIVDMFTADEPIDPHAVRGWLDLHGWPAGVEPLYLHDLLEAHVSDTHAISHAKKVIRLARRRAAREKVTRATQQLDNGVDLDVVVGELEEALRGIPGPQDGSTPTRKTPQDAANEAALVRERATAEARRRVADEQADAAFTEPDLGPIRLDELLAAPPRPKLWTIEGLHRTGSNRLLTAQFKTGKTTTVLNEIRSLVDGWPLYDRFNVTQITDGSVAMFNYEVDSDQIREWFSELGIRNTRNVSVFNLRGVRMSLVSDRGIETAVRWLKDCGARYWILDPYTRALSSCGLSENSNDDVARFTDTLDEIKRLAGVDDLLVASHTGRGEQETGAERTRGATRLDDWADIRQLLVRGKDDDRDSRYMWAEGRDVDVEEFKLEFDPEHRRLGAEDGSRAGRKSGAVLEDTIECVAANPGTTSNGVVLILSHSRAKVLKALKDAEKAGRIYSVAGPNNARLHYLQGAGPGLPTQVVPGGSE